MSPGRRLPGADLHERADDRAHHLPAERVGADLVAQHAVALVDPRATRARGASVDEPSGPLRQNDAKSCSPTNGSAPSRSARRSSGVGHPPREAIAERIGHRPVEDRVAVRAAIARRGGRRSRGVDELGTTRTTTSGPSIELTAAWSRHGSRPGSRREAHDLAPRVHAGVGAARARELAPSWRRTLPIACAEHAADRAHAGLAGLRREPAEVGAVVGDDQLHLRRAGTRGARRRRVVTSTSVSPTESSVRSDELDARHGRVVARARAELQDARVAAVAVGVARPDLVEQLVRDVLVVDARRRPGAACARRRASPWSPASRRRAAAPSPWPRSW